MTSTAQAGLGPELEAAIAAWSLVPEGPAFATAASTVLFVRRGGERLVLKRLGPDEARQPEALGHYRGRAAVALIAREGPLMLMERAIPGVPLSELLWAEHDDEATHILAELMGRLHSRPPPPWDRTVEDWGAGFIRVGERALAAGADAQLLHRASRLYEELCRSQGAPVLLHGDLHHDNVLRDDARGWLAIDPKGALGEPAYEAGALLRNPGEDPAFYAPAIIARRTAILCERLGLERERVLGWAFSQAALSALWSIEDGGDPGPAWRMAEATLSLL